VKDGRWQPGRKLSGDDILLNYHLAEQADVNQSGSGLRFGPTAPRCSASNSTAIIEMNPMRRAAATLVLLFAPLVVGGAEFDLAPNLASRRSRAMALTSGPNPTSRPKLSFFSVVVPKAIGASPYLWRRKGGLGQHGKG